MSIFFRSLISSYGHATGLLLMEVRVIISFEERQSPTRKRDGEKTERKIGMKFIVCRLSLMVFALAWKKKYLYPYDDRVKICDPHASVALGYIIRVMENYLKSRIQESRRVSIN